MAPDAVVSERVYASVKAQILTGQLAPGRRLELKRIAYDEQVSITPVRDAIHRLVGEKLLTFQGHGGFEVPILTEAGLRDLYTWHLQLVQLALASSSRESEAAYRSLAAPGSDAGDGQIVDLTEALFGQLIDRSNNRELRNAGLAVAERLRPVRHAEISMIERSETEVADLHRICATANDDAIFQAISRYHDRRMQLVADLVELLRDVGH